MNNKGINLYIDLDRLPQYAENVGRSLRAGNNISTHRCTSALSRDLKRLRIVCQEADRFAAAVSRLPAELEWLLDNRYIAEREAKSVIADLKNVRLPAALSDKKYPVVFEAASALVRSGRGEISHDRILSFLEHFQNAYVLSEKELALFFPMIKLSLLSALSRTADDIRVMLRAKLCSDSSSPFFAEDEIERLRNKNESPINPDLLQKAAEARTKHEDLTSSCAVIFSSLRLLSTLDSAELLESVSRVERTLLQDPSGVYPNMEQDSRTLYRMRIAKIAKRNSISEFDAASKILELSKQSEPAEHIGTFIFHAPLGIPKKSPATALYPLAILIPALFCSLFIPFSLALPLLSLLLFLPSLEIFKNLSDFLILKFTPPYRMPRMSLPNGIPINARTLCVISSLLASPSSGVDLAALLEEYKLANRAAGSELLFGILADLKESRDEVLESDTPCLDAARSAIDSLNSKYGGGFFLFSRPRSFSPRDNKFVGWERKRGAIIELIRLIKGESASMSVCGSSNLALEGVKFIILLDSDTRLSVDSARELVGTITHPLNAPYIDPDSAIVTRGHAILQPRIAVDLAAANKSDFTRIFAGQGGIDPYGSNSADVYQDLFDEGSFSGKGIISVDAFYHCLNHRLPLNSILSHDLLEGAYLRSGFLSDTEFTDGFPFKISAYFERMHRWIRGDWQISPWLFSSVRNEEGRKVANPISPINKWKIFDNLRRSLTPPAIFLSILLPLFIPPLLLPALLTAFIALTSNLLLHSVDSMLRPGGALKPKYRSNVISGGSALLLQTLLQLLLLPFSAYISLHAVFTALYRMLISKRNMLAWVTAAESDKKPADNVAIYYLKMFVLPLSGLLAIFSAYPPAIALGILWILSPAAAFFLSRPDSADIKLSPEDRLFLSKAAIEIWRYFEKLLTPDRAFLPPDNWQEEPAAGTAERTSPTNIGLALLAALSAFDLGFCSREKALELITNITATIERLPKWNGHLFNWYDLKTLRPLEPAYISTVDSGNLCGCLIALIEGLRELDGTENIIERLLLLNNAVSFKPLYDPVRKLFFIGFDITDNKPTNGWYDLMASEARQTSFIAIARGEVDKKHWQRLGRIMVSQNGLSGMASWTGTMFEYFMPNLLMPWYKNSLIYESLKFCLYAHKKRNIPWGISESAFYAFDTALSYKYKAHGVQLLALKRGMERETVISPYSSFLALPFDPKNSIKNLKRLRKLGMEGRYGFYEAADFTPSRTAGKDYEIVRCFMAHHIGMSLIAINNALNNGLIQNRFMRDPSMAGHAELLQEKGPVGQVISTHHAAEFSEKPERIPSETWKKSFTGIDIANPACTLLSNGAYTVLLTELGTSRSSKDNISVTAFEAHRFDAQGGIRFYLKSGPEIISLQPSPTFDKATAFLSEFSGEFGRIYSRRKSVEACIEVFVPQGELGEHRSVSIKNTSEDPRDFELICYFEPVLAPDRDYRAHPAFSKLSMQSSVREGAVLFKRRPGIRGPSLSLCFACSEKSSFDTSREIALSRGAERAIPFAASRPSSASLGDVIDPCILMKSSLRLKPGENKKIHFALTVAEDEDSAFLSAQRVLKLRKLRGTTHLDAAAKSLDMTPAEISEAMSRLSPLLFTTPDRNSLARLIINNCSGKPGLWRFGISGDYPVLAVIAAAEEDAEKAVRFIKEHALISQNGFLFDLVFVINDGGSYRQPIRTLLNDAIRNLGREGFLSINAGIHLVDGGTPDTEALLSMCNCVIDISKQCNSPARIVSPIPESRYLLHNYNRRIKTPEWQFDSSNTFVFTTGGGLNCLCWSHMLTNGNLGWLAADSGCGNLWYKNAREFRITPWRNDPLLIRSAETLELIHDGIPYSLFADCDSISADISFGFGFASYEKHFGSVTTKLTAFIHPEIDARVFILDLSGFSDNDKINYYSELILGAEEDDCKSVETKVENGLFCAVNHGNSGGMFILCASSDAINYSCDRLSWQLGYPNKEEGAGCEPCFGIQYKAADKLVIVCGIDEREKIKMLADPEKAEYELEQTKRYWKTLVCPVRISTADKALDRYINGWALYQVLACRVLGRTSIYQSGGAYGFRDQLQDVCALIDSAPEVARRQIEMACSHQYEEGDVQHWWHQSPAGNDRGVRTHCSDDLLWLPYTVSEYCEKTGDLSILNLETEYIRSSLLRDAEPDRYETAEKCGVSATVYEHCIKAIDEVLRRGSGSHGLLLIGDGDWNDGFNRVGTAGRGESVWLTWFAALTIDRFSKLCSIIDDSNQAQRYRDEAKILGRSADNAWDGRWYLRGYYDNGKPLGSDKNDECRIDSIAQSFAVLSGFGSSERSSQAIRSALDYLFDKEFGIIKLFDPPFDAKGENPGYIMGYLPGTRENGGQYTHAAVWLASACLKSGLTNEGKDLLRTLLPLNRNQERYKTEPYVLTADVYSNPQHPGRGGWSWYTGAASWFYRVVLEDLLGIRQKNGEYTLNPQLPSDWEGFSAVINTPNGKLYATVSRGGKHRLLVDSKHELHSNSNPL